MKNQKLEENDIRPAEFQENKKKAVDADRNYLLERKSSFVASSCPACGGNNKKGSFSKLGIDYDKCTSCNTVYVNPRPSKELLHEFYAQSKTYDYWNKYIFPASDKARKDNIFVPRAERLVEFCENYEVEKGILLESGAGFGTFCEVLSEQGYFERVIALEPSPGLAKTCRDKGLEVIESPIEKLDGLKDSVNVIASFEVIEHLYSPEEFLTKCYELLKTNGLVVISCPNFYGFDIATLKEVSNSIDHEHLNYFNPDSLSLLLEKVGFEVLETITPGKLDADIVRNKVLNKEFYIDDNPFLENLLIDKWDELGEKFQEFLAENNLSSHLWAVARKN